MKIFILSFGCNVGTQYVTYFGTMTDNCTHPNQNVKLKRLDL